MSRPAKSIQRYVTAYFDLVSAHKRFQSSKGTSFLTELKLNLATSLLGPTADNHNHT
jgi:hypothetical protein